MYRFIYIYKSNNDTVQLLMRFKVIKPLLKYQVFYIYRYFIYIYIYIYIYIGILYIYRYFIYIGILYI